MKDTKQDATSTAARPSWWQIIDEAEKRRHFTGEEKWKSGSWVDCACGQQDPLLPRYADGVPKDVGLTDLGLSFCTAVCKNRFAIARKALAKIEARSAEILSALPAVKA